MAGYARLSNHYWQDKDVLKLRRRNPAAALLHVLTISWCSDHASDGEIDEDTLLFVLGADEQDVADLVASGMLQPVPDKPGTYVLRSYLKYQNSAEQIEQARDSAAKRQQRKRERDKAAQNNETTAVTSASNDAHTDVTPMSRRDIEDVTGMSFNQEPITKNEEINPPLTPPTEGPEADEAFDDEGFTRFETAYPKHGNRTRTLDAYRATLRSGATPAQLEASATAYAKACRSEGKPARYIPQPANWLTNGQWRDHLPPPERTPMPSEAWINRHLVERLPDGADLTAARTRLVTLIRDGTSAPEAAETIIHETRKEPPQ